MANQSDHDVLRDRAMDECRVWLDEMDAAIADAAAASCAADLDRAAIRWENAARAARSVWKGFDWLGALAVLARERDLVRGDRAYEELLRTGQPADVPMRFRNNPISGRVSAYHRAVAAVEAAAMAVSWRRNELEDVQAALATAQAELDGFWTEGETDG